MPAQLQWYDDTDTTEQPTLSFAPVNGTPTAAQEVHLWNDIGGALGATDSLEILLTAYSRNTGSGSYSQDDDVALNGWVEVRLIDVAGTGIVAQTTSWTAIGRNRFLAVRPIPAECARHLEVRLNIPAGVGTQAKQVRLRMIEGSRAFATAMGLRAGGVMGLRMPLGDTATYQVLEGGVVTAQGSPDDTVAVTTLVGIGGGVPNVIVAHNETISDVDGDAATLGSGEEYFCALCYDGSDTLAQVKGSKGTAPIADTLEPEIPENHVCLSMIRRNYDAVIETAHLDSALMRWGGAYLEDTGDLQPRLWSFEVVAGDMVVVSATYDQLSLTGSATNYVWALPAGTVGTNTTGVPPENGAILLYEPTTDSGAITALADRRPWMAPNLYVMTLQLAGTLSGGETSNSVLPRRANAMLLPIGGVVLAMGDQGTTSGANTFDINYSEEGAAFATIFTSQSTVDLRPSVPYDASDPVDSEARPEVLVFKGGTRFQAECDTVAGAGTPGDATVQLVFAFPAVTA